MAAAGSPTIRRPTGNDSNADEEGCRPAIRRSSAAEVVAPPQPASRHLRREAPAPQGPQGQERRAAEQPDAGEREQHAQAVTLLVRGRRPGHLLERDAELLGPLDDL